MKNALHKEFIHTLMTIQSESEMDAFLHGILTPQEFSEIPKRMAIFKLLHAGVAQHSIAKKIGVGVATVTRGSMEVKRGQIQKTGWWQNLTIPLGG